MLYFYITLYWHSSPHIPQHKPCRRVHVVPIGVGPWGGGDTPSIQQQHHTGGVRPGLSTGGCRYCPLGSTALVLHAKLF